MQAIWTLADLGGLDAPTVLAGLEDPDPRVREAVIAAAWPWARQARTVADALIRAVDDTDSRVRFQVALALGNIDEEPAGAALARLVRRDGNDPWMRAAILSSAARNIDTLLLTLLRDRGPGPGDQPPPAAILGPLLNVAVSQSNRAPIELITRTIAVPAGQGGRYAPWQFTTLAGLLDARDHAARSNELDLDQPFAAVWSAAHRIIADAAAPEAERIAAAQLIGYRARRNSKDRDLLVGLLAAPGLDRSPASRHRRPGDG